MARTHTLTLASLLDQVTGCHEREAALSELLVKRRYRCSSAAILAYTVILELFSEASGDAATLARISTNLDLEVAELQLLRRRLRALGA